MKQVQENFLWGGALSNVQSEGAHLLGGKGLSVFDTTVRGAQYGNTTVFSDTSVASDHYNHFKEDIDLMKEMGFKAYRFSIVWSRIHPDGEGKTNEEGLKFYDEMIDYLLKNDIEPIVSLVHFDMPDNLAQKYNGFVDKKVVELFQRHVEVVVDYFKEKVKYWITYNEINLVAHSRLVAGATLPTDMDAFEFHHRLIYHTQLAHAKAVEIIKKAIPTAKVSGMIACEPRYPKTSHPLDIQAAYFANKFKNYLFFDIMVFGEFPQYYNQFMKIRNVDLQYQEEDLTTIKNASKKLDFLSISYYKTEISEHNEKLTTLQERESDLFANEKRGVRNPYLKASDWGWHIDSEGLRTAIKFLYERYHKPVFVVENGIGLQEELNENNTVEDNARIEYYREHIQAVKNCVTLDGIPVMGYLAWAPIDFLSSHREMKKRYGFIYINRTETELLDLKRYRKKSFNWYQKVIASNGGDLM